MKDLIGWMFQWAFSVAGLIHLIGVAVLAGAAIWFSRARSVSRFFLVALGLWVVASIFGATTSSTPRVALAGILWALSVIAVYTLFLGMLVAKGKGPRAVLATSLVLFMLQTPLSLLSGLYLTCYVGHDCP